MKKNLKRLFAIALSSIFFNWSSAQAGKDIPPPEERAKKQTEWMRSNLNLTDAQAGQAESINLKYANNIEQLRASPGGNRQKLKTLKSYGKAKDDELKKVFTPDQYKTYQAKKEELTEKLKEEFRERKNAAG